MTNRISKEQRSWNMSRIRNRDTRPELKLRSMLHRVGFRFRLHNRNLPGKPDIILKKYRTVIFVHGCYWHRHEGCANATTPGTRTEFWQAKFDSNVRRDRQVRVKLEAMGWRVIVVWECELEGGKDELLNCVEQKLKGNN